MDLFKKNTMAMANSLDWNCKNIVKRRKGDTQRIHKNARKKIKEFDRKLLIECQ